MAPVTEQDYQKAAARAVSGERLSLGQAEALREGAGLLELGRLASLRRETLSGRRVSYVINLHLNLSNLCVNHCRFCAFRREPGSPDAYELTPEEVWRQAERLAPEGVREFHLVSGLSPNLRLEYHERVLRGLRERFPSVHLKAFTAVEIDHQARLNGLDVETVLERLIEAGLGSLTGGGAETLGARARLEACPEKLDGEGYLDIHAQAHRLGLRSTATLLFGHVETPRERLEHLFRLRDLQDETGGFTAFVPLVFHPDGTLLADLPKATARQALETIAMARLVLDNFPHIKAYWISLGPKLAQVALAWGADDLDGTVTQEQIHHSAGAAAPQAMTPDEIERLIREAGFEPYQRDTLYNEVKSVAKPSVLATRAARPAIDLDAVAQGRRRMTTDEATRLLESGDLIELGQAADAMRHRLHPEPVVTYAVDRNINTTNACESLCGFCAFAREPEDPECWTLDRETIAEKIEELRVLSEQLGSPFMILLQGGLSPRLDLEWYEGLFRWMRGRWPRLHIHALSPPEIVYFSRLAGLEWRQTIARLRRAGLNSIPGGGAEILSDRVRAAVSPGKCSADEWIGVMRAAHQEGLRTSATMVIGLGETAAERAEHLERVRSLQDETQGFTAFIPWTFQAGNTTLGQSDEAPAAVGAWNYLRTLAVARLYLDNVDNLQASWVTQGKEIAQLALLFGANDLGSTMLEENVVAAAGTRFRMSPEDLERLAKDLGRRLEKRDFFYTRQP